MKKQKNLESLKNECFKLEKEEFFFAKGGGGMVVDSHKGYDFEFAGKKYRIVALDSKLGSGFPDLWY